MLFFSILHSVSLFNLKLLLSNICSSYYSDSLTITQLLIFLYLLILLILSLSLQYLHAHLPTGHSLLLIFFFSMDLFMFLILQISALRCSDRNIIISCQAILVRPRLWN